MKVLAVSVGVILFAAGDASAQECSRRYMGEEHSTKWEYLTIDARSMGRPWEDGISVANQPTRVCGHDGDRPVGGNYCGAPADHEWRLVWACGRPPTVTLQLSPSTIPETAGMSTVTASLNRATSEDVTVTVSTAPVSPAGSEDFSQTGTTLTIRAGSTTSTGTVTIAAENDVEDTPDKEVTVNGAVTAGPTGVPAPAARTLTITDDEATSTTVTLSVDTTSVSESAGSTTVMVTGTLDEAARTSATEVTVSVGDGTAAAGTDFDTVNDFTLTILAGSTIGTETFDLVPTDDEIAEGVETVAVSGSATGFTVDPATMRIIDDDAPPERVILSVNPATVDEGDGSTRITVTGTLDGAVLGAATTVSVSVSGGTATVGEDFPAVSDFPLTIAAEERSGRATFTLTPVDDAAEEDDETLIVSGTTNDLTVDSATVTITGDDDETPGGPPTFVNARYAFTLSEHQDGRETPVRLGVATASDPDDQPLTYVLAAGDATRFAVGASSGAVDYVGPGEDIETGPPSYELMVTARDTDRQTASVAVEVTIIDAPEAPVASDDTAETREGESQVIDVLANDHDPDGDRLGVSSVTAPEHGRATVVSGGVRYTPSLHYHGRDEFRYTVSDPGGLTATATVKMTVTPVNDPPEAVDDEAETLEDEPVLVDVLANDTDVDGDRLRVVAATAPIHGTTTVLSWGVRYSPALDYHGPDRFVYTVSDPSGLTDTATVTLTVRPVNDAPEAVGVIPDQTLEEGGEAVTLDVAPYFMDVDGDALTYTAESSNPSATLVTVAGSTLTLSPVVRGAAAVTVTATDPERLTATQVFGVTVDDRLVREVLTDTLAALGRGHLSSVRQTLGRRLQSGGGSRRLSVAGQSFGPEAWDRPVVGGLAQTHDLLFRAATLQQGDATDMLGTSADPRLRQPGTLGGFSSFGPGWERALPSTDVLMAFGGTDNSADEATGRRARWTVWGQGDLQTFRGTPTDAKGYEGDLRTGYLGVDAQVSPRWLLGVAMARSGGASTWERGGAAGKLSTTLTRVHPYVRWADEKTAVWGVLGAGRGTATHVRTLTGLREASRLGLGLGLLEGRRRVATVVRGLEIAVRGEASWARLGTGEGGETIDDLEAGVRRTRAGVEMTRALSGPGGVTFAPFGTVSTRHDGGAGQTGVGVEVAGGMRVRGGRLEVEAQGRRLVLHSATAYEEQGASVAASVGAGPYEPGLTLSLRPTWGAAGTGAETLWQDQFRTYMPGYDQSGIDAQLGYGMRLPGGRLLTPFGSYGQRRNSGRRLQVGAMVGSLGQIPGALDSPIRLEISGERYERAGGSADYRLSLFGVVNLGGSSPSYANPLGIEPGVDVPAAELTEAAALQDTVPPAPEPGLDEPPFDQDGVRALAEAAASELAPAEMSSRTDAPTDAAPRLSTTVESSMLTTVAARLGTGAEIPGLHPTTPAAAPVQAPAARTPASTQPGVAKAATVRPAVVAPVTRYATNAPRRQTRPAPESRAVDGKPSAPRSNRSPAFSTPAYVFEAPARREGSGTEVPLGAVLARDPEGDAVAYSLTAGDWTRFRVTPSTGAIVYLGPDLPGTRRYRLQVMARDTARRTATATVVVTVASATEAPDAARETAPTAARQVAPSAPKRITVNPVADAASRVAVARPDAGSQRTAMAPAAGATPPAPVARADTAAQRSPVARAVAAVARSAGVPVADKARTYKDVPVLIDVLANDGDVDGQRIVAVAGAAHGTVTVSDGMVRYAPAPGHRGRDTFTYTVVLRGGRTARATVTVMIVG